jgi:transcriptional regulator with XRE-family HTH domain
MKAQRSLADQLPFSRSTVANIETGRQQAPREFWQLCDDLLGAGGDLLAAHDRLAAAVERQAHAELQPSARSTNSRTDGVNRPGRA